MVAIHVPLNKGTVYTPVTKTCRVSTIFGMIRQPYVWVRINDISSLYPDGYFRTDAMAAARKFVDQMEKQGFSLLSAEADMLVYGPLRHRDFSKQSGATWRPQPGMAPTFRTVGFAHSEEPDSDAEDYLLRAQFLAKRVHMIEYVKKEGDA